MNVLFEKDASGFTKKAYTRGLGFPGGIGGLISMKRHETEEDDEEDSDPKVSYYHYDALGSVRGLSNEKGKLTAELDYDAFGNGKNNKKWNTCRFSSKEFEDHADLYHFGARYYDPEIGRWLTLDPLGFIDGPNKYLYVGNNPVNWIDAWGLTKEEILAAYNWLKVYRPEVTAGIDPQFFDISIPDKGTLGLALPFNLILVDSDKIKTSMGGMDWIVATVAHESLHAQEGFLKTILRDKATADAYHTKIYDQAEQIRRDYLNFLQKQDNFKEKKVSP